MSWTVHEDEHKSNEPDLEQIFLGTRKWNEEVTTKPSENYTKNSQLFSPPTLFLAASPSSLGCDALSPNWGFSTSPTSSNVVRPFFSYSQQPNVNSQVTQGLNASFEPHHKTSEIFPSSTVNGKRRGHNIEGQGGNLRRRSLTVDERSSADLNAFSFSERSNTSNISSSKNSSPCSQSLAISNHNNSVEALSGEIYETAKDQHGCRFLQRWLETNCNAEAVQSLMNEIIPHVGELMTDQYANFLLQKLFDVMPSDVRLKVAQVAAPKIASIAVTPHGTFSVQKMIETISSPEELEIIREALSEDVVRLVKDAHGNHVIQKVLNRFRSADKQFIYDAVSKDCVGIAMNKQGCCVLQRCLEHASPSQKSSLVNHILSCCLDIVQDPFGNYVLQYVLDEKDSKINDTIAIAFLPHVVHLCMNKFSSNVMEKVLRGASIQIQETYVERMCNPDIVSCLIQDDYGNYVLQTALMISNPVQAEILVTAIRPLLPLIKNAPYAKKLESKMDSIIKRSEGSFRQHSDFDEGIRVLGSISEQKRDRRGNGYANRYAHSPPSAWIQS